MRRKDREVTDPAKIQDIMERCTCCRVGFKLEVSKLSCKEHA